jgi:uncharacterized membrane protein
MSRARIGRGESGTWRRLCALGPPALAALVAAGAGCGRGAAQRQPGASYAEARQVIDKHCVSCHSDQPTVPAFPIAPNGVVFDTADQMRLHASSIKARTVVDKTMPLLNKTGMTDAEREVLRRWIDGGAGAQ